MQNRYRVVRGLPDEEPLLDLLNGCFERWGDGRFLNWKYTRPGADTATGYRIVRDGDLVGFRGMFERVIEGETGGYEFHVCGDACIAAGHRGQGLYSQIRKATESAIERDGSDFCSLFTRKEHVPFEVGLDRGWNYRTLPLYLRVLSPGNVIPHYARLALDESGVVAAILDRFGGRITLDTGGDEFRLDRLLDGSTGDPGRSISIPFPERATTAAVEIAGSDSLGGSLRRRLSSGRPGPAGDVEIRTRPTVDEDLLGSMATLYDEVTNEYDLAFRRSIADVRHLLDHPRRFAVVTARRRDRIVGAAPVVLTETADTLEAWVLDTVVADDEAFVALLDGVEEVATARDADMLLMMSDVDPGREWARIDKQVLMWNSYGVNTRPLETDSLFIGLYDVV
ncbi:hypothetical protein ACFPM1_11540 [Halorubrum rubrum]|uniref:GNAT family N-acetyltransferase n=1 Tax=Halorubrum rubrum TaxID=1126240 RepID=A0ABD5R3B0_9EURY|nr:hypothetical protein [Halorubrum rubrum]